MPEKIIPFARTLLLPAGSPAIGRVDGVDMDVTGLCCHCSGDSCYCQGDVDVLIQYCSAPPDSGSLFGGPQRPGKAWQALLTLPLELIGQAEGDWTCVPVGDYQPELRHLEWFLVASNAVEMEGTLAVSWTEPETANQSIREPQASSTASKGKEQLEPGLAWQPAKFAQHGMTRGQLTRGWNMVNREQERQESGEVMMEEQIQQLADHAEQTAAAANQLWQTLDQKEEEIEPNVVEETPEGVQLNQEEHSTDPESMRVALPEDGLRQAIAQSLSGGETDATELEDREELREGVVVRMRFGAPQDVEEKRLYYSDSAAENPVPSMGATLDSPEEERALQPSAKVHFGWTPSASTDTVENQPQKDAKSDSPIETGEMDASALVERALAEEASLAAEPELKQTEIVSPEPRTEQNTSAVEPPIASPERAPATPTLCKDSVPPIEEKDKVFSEPPRVEADPVAMVESLDTALEPEVLPPEGKKPRKRRAVGLPHLQIDARDNTVEISAFNLQIKL